MRLRKNNLNRHVGKDGTGSKLFIYLRKCDSQHGTSRYTTSKRFSSAAKNKNTTQVEHDIIQRSAERTIDLGYAITRIPRRFHALSLLRPPWHTHYMIYLSTLVHDDIDMVITHSRKMSRPG
ncbi:hypothetical protein PGQ11_013228 [Apiospora arundinis]|uniref:Uncharacterized protein n=1 Tax=Apiospora arundinis TaxID=335852 RepID=A0ABR2I4P9_9PEZI